MGDAGDTRGDAELVAHTLAGDREAFGRLYDRYARLVRAVALGAARDATTAQDLTQECFLRAYRNLRSLREPGSFGPWVVGIARQLVREQRRRRQPGSLGVFDPPAAAPRRSADDEDEIAHVLGLVSRLPEEERLAVHFFFLGQRDVGETARLLKRSRSGTYALLKRACARLARRLGLPGREREGTS
jgi:RNA polymerase sigma-70 factor (ECF subfamily)